MTPWPDFLEWFLPLLAAYWLAPASYRLALAGVAGLGYLAWHDMAGAIAAVIVFTLAFGAPRFRDQRAGLAIGIGALGGAVVAYKLWQGWAVADSSGPFLLLGFAFIVLRALHYVIEEGLGRHPAHGPLDVFAYAFFFPAILIGPLHRFDAFMREGRRSRWDAASASLGLERLLFGAFKIVVLGNVVVSQWLAGYAHGLEGQPGLAAYLGCWVYGLNLYCQFGGLSDVAIGAAALLGVRLPENFRFPLLQPNLLQFWRAWHATLGAWCRDYVYAPVAALTRRPGLGMVAAMLVLAGWHELSPRYLAWGAYHGVGLAISQGLAARTPWVATAPLGARCLMFVGGWAITLHFVVLGFALTKEPTLAEGLRVWRTIAGGAW